MKTLAVTFVALIVMTSAVQAGSYKLYYTLYSGSTGVQGGYNSYEDCMKAGNGSASFAKNIKSFYCAE